MPKAFLAERILVRLQLFVDHYTTSVFIYYYIMSFLVGVFEENARLLQWLFFSSVQRNRPTFLFISPRVVQVDVEQMKL